VTRFVKTILTVKMSVFDVFAVVRCDPRADPLMRGDHPCPLAGAATADDRTDAGDDAGTSNTGDRTTDCTTGADGEVTDRAGV